MTRKEELKIQIFDLSFAQAEMRVRYAQLEKERLAKLKEYEECLKSESIKNS